MGVGGTERVERVRALYAAFADGDLETVLAAMSPDVEWPDGWSGEVLVGRDAVRGYWETQWVQVRPVLLLRSVTERPDGLLEARGRLTVRDPSGAVLDRSDFVHLLELDGDVVRRMTQAPPR